MKLSTFDASVYIVVLEYEYKCNSQTEAEVVCINVSNFEDSLVKIYYVCFFNEPWQLPVFPCPDFRNENEYHLSYCYIHRKLSYHLIIK